MDIVSSGWISIKEPVLRESLGVRGGEVVVRLGPLSLSQRFILNFVSRERESPIRRLYYIINTCMQSPF